MKYAWFILLFLATWGCSSGSKDTAGSAAADRGQVFQDLAGVWIHPEPLLHEGIILLDDGRCIHWARDYLVFHGTWSIQGEDAGAPEMALSFGGQSDRYPVARYNAKSLQLRGSGSLSGVLRRGTLGTLEGTVELKGRFPRDATLHVDLSRWGRPIGNHTSEDREELDACSLPPKGSRVPFTLHYIEDFLGYFHYEIRAWVTGPDDGPLATTPEPVPVDLHQAEPVVQVVLEAPGS